MDQLQPTTSALPNELMVPVTSLSSVRTSIQSLKPDEEMTAPLDQYRDVLQNVGINSSSLPVTPMRNYSGFQQLIIPNRASGNSGVIFNNLKPVTVHMPVKRKSSMENVPTHLLSPRKVMPSKKIGLLEHRPWLNIYSPTQSNVQHHVQSLAGVLASQQWATKKKRTTKFVPGPPKSGFPKCSTPRSLPIQGRNSPRVQNEPNETVRLKLRESISAALALVTEKEKSLSTKDTSTSAGATASEQIQEVFQSAEFASSVISAELPVGKPKEANEDCSTECENNMKSQLSAIPSNLTDNNLLHSHESVDNELSIADMMQYEEPIDGNFFVKDDLLQGNGLSWVLDFDAWVAEKEGHESEKQNIGETVIEAPEVKNTNSPQTLALQIELELFKLFDGVNKKYKEKGRSLLFNLKDKNNPELREKVMSGEISPARLCKMTAEELASKELSEWRIAKAEEFEHLKILPDSDIDIRRLVKKTHKGEYQLEVEEYDVSVSVEVSVASSSLPRILSETNETKSPSVPISAGDHMDTVNDEINSEVQNLRTTTVPTNMSSDLMQGIIEDDIKDPEFLPPIVSLDEFMESLQTETPFENVSVDADKTAASLDNAHSEVPLETKSSKLSTDNHTDSKDQNQDTDAKPTDSKLETRVSPPVDVSKGERIWEGILQLSNSSKISVSGFFKSGEKVSTKDWCRALEIKGRVRMDAFEKFLHDLNKSRTRAIMVCDHFYLISLVLDLC